MHDRSRLERALRRNRGERLVANWCQELSGATGLNITTEQLLDVDTTKLLKTAFLEKVRALQAAGNSQFWQKDSVSAIDGLLAATGERLGELNVVLFSSVDDLIGAAYLSASAVLSHPWTVWRVVEQDLSLCTLGIEDGICLEEHLYSADGAYVREGMYQLTSWGALRGVAFEEQHEYLLAVAASCSRFR